MYKIGEKQKNNRKTKQNEVLTIFMNGCSHSCLSVANCELRETLSEFDRLKNFDLWVKQEQLGSVTTLVILVIQNVSLGFGIFGFIEWNLVFVNSISG